MSHPNTPFVESVLTSLREGFWPWVDTRHGDGYPETWDNSWAPPASKAEQAFLANQRDVEIEKHRFSPQFGPDLLPGMYSTPVLAVPKPHSEKLRPWPTDGHPSPVHPCSPTLSSHARECPSCTMEIRRVRSLPTPPCSSLMADQAGRHHKYPVDWRSCFGSCASPHNWASIMGLVLWVAIFIKLLLDLVRALSSLLPNETSKVSPPS